MNARGIVTRRRAISAAAILGIGAALAAAVLAVLLAGDLRAWPHTVARDDALYRNGVATPAWTAAPAFPSDAAERILGLPDQLELRRTLAAARAVLAQQVRLDNGLDIQGQRAEIENRLAGLTASGDRRIASQASDLLGVLSFGDLARGGYNGRPQAETALAAFQNAVRLDPANAAARWNLEVVLRLLLAHGSRLGPGLGSGATTGRHGADGGLPGRGY